VLEEVVRDFDEWEPPPMVERELRVPLNLGIRRAVSLIGPRRAGKTYYMFQLIRRVRGRGRGVLYVNLEDYRLTGLDYRGLGELLEVFYELHPEARSGAWLFLDEVQNVEGWERAVRTFIDRGGVRVFLTGSSSKLLSSELATQLRGRTLAYEVFPFSFREFLGARGFRARWPFSSRERSRLLGLLREYVEWGGYPEAVLEPRVRAQVLREIWEVTVTRDVVERWGVRNVKALRLLVAALQGSREFSAHRFYNYLRSLGLRVGKNTVYNYLEYLRDTLTVFLLHRYSPSYKRVEASIPKVYLVDDGLYGSKEWGRLFENTVFMELRRRGLREDAELYYWRGHSGEVDFVAPREGLLVQATVELGYDNERRELRPLAKASRELGAAKAYVITWDQEGVYEVEGVRVEAVPLWKWLIGRAGPLQGRLPA